ncbi:Hypothetical predicted protein [Podarcis lilfordi]|uniref:Uncharacterized protein n=1 Tax=Podarcis lilfordi TaxID=74358 RepID=A0AA35P4L3_9SAUR|nr:Hypothetical predicted protein [Podarcis lilfordi]
MLSCSNSILNTPASYQIPIQCIAAKDCFVEFEMVVAEHVLKCSGQPLHSFNIQSGLTKNAPPPKFSAESVFECWACLQWHVMVIGVNLQGGEKDREVYLIP